MIHTSQSFLYAHWTLFSFCSYSLPIISFFRLCYCIADWVHINKAERNRKEGKKPNEQPSKAIHKRGRKKGFQSTLPNASRFFRQIRSNILRSGFHNFIFVFRFLVDTFVWMMKYVTLRQRLSWDDINDWAF